MNKRDFIEDVLALLDAEWGWTSEQCPGTSTYDIFLNDGTNESFQINFPDSE